VPLLCIAFVTASVATGIFYGLLGNKLRDVSASAPRRPLVVAAHNLERGTVLKAVDVKLSTWGGAELPKGGYTAVDQVTGKTIHAAILENEPVTEARVASQSGGGGIGIPSGMRAVSVHATDSSGVLSLLQAGYKVDVQAVADRQGGDLRLRTMLQNVEVLAVQPAESTTGRGAAPVVTLLAKPADADRLAVADAGGRIRLLLRNPLDDREGARRVVAMANVFADNYDGGRPVFPQVAGVAVAARASSGGQRQSFPGRVDLLVRVAAAQSSAIDEFVTASHGSPNTRALQVVRLAPGPRSDQIMRLLETTHRIEMLSSSQVTTDNHHTTSMQTGATWGAQPDAAGAGTWDLRVQFQAFTGRAGMLRLRVQPEISRAESAGVVARKIVAEVELSRGQTFVIMGLSNAQDWPSLADRLFAGRLNDASDRELVVLVTLDVPKPVHSLALAGRR
jgi:pilus assembly protein CpaB